MPPATIITTANFRREAKPLLKKYPLLKPELACLVDILLEDSTHGEPLGRIATRFASPLPASAGVKVVGPASSHTAG